MNPFVESAIAGCVVVFISIGIFVNSTNHRITFIKICVVTALIAGLVFMLFSRRGAQISSSTSPKPIFPYRRMPKFDTYAPVDSEMYGLRVPHAMHTRDMPTPHLDQRPPAFVRLLRRVLTLGSVNGSIAAGTRLVAALEDFFTRIDNLSKSIEKSGSDRLEPLSRMTFGMLSDGRAASLCALQELELAVPRSSLSIILRTKRWILHQTSLEMRNLRDNLIRQSRSRTSAYAHGIMISSEESGCDRRPIPYTHSFINEHTIY